MAMIHMESHDHGSLGKYTALSGTSIPFISAGNGRYGTAGMGLHANNQADLWLPANYSTLIVAFGHNCLGIASGGADVLEFQDAGNQQCQLNFNAAAGTYIFRRGSTVLGTYSTLPYNDAIMRHYQVKATFHGTTGYLELKINNNSVLTVATGNTIQTANAYANRIRLRGWAVATPASYLDDLCVADTSGTVNNDWLGDIKVRAKFPNGDTTPSQWTPNSGTVHYDRVNQTSPDGDTTYLSTSTTNNVDAWTMEDLAETSGTVKAVQIVKSARKDDAGNRTIAPYLDSGGTTYVGANMALLDSYKYFWEMFNLDPTDNASWDIAKVNALKIGTKLIA